MDNVKSFTPFKREDHVYHNEAFAELCKDAIRAFNGTPVCELPPPRFAGSGVYALYCTARKGIYERYGNKVNRMGYNVPIYVGKAVPKGDADGEAMSFDMLSCQEQLEFWHKKIKAAVGLSVGDFRCRVSSMDGLDVEYIGEVHRMMFETYHPVWNRFFATCVCSDEITLWWRQIHAVRFRSKADTYSQKLLRHFVEVA